LAEFKSLKKYESKMKKWKSSGNNCINYAEGQQQQQTGM